MDTKTTLLSAILLTALTAGTAAAQEAPSARHVAAQVQTFYDQTGAFEARFVQTYYSRIYGSYERSRGALAFQKPGRMRFDYDRPNGKVIASDGREITMWEPGDEPGSAGQYVKTPVRDAALPAAFSFLLGQGRLEESYRFRLLDSRTYRFSGHVLELRPLRRDPRFTRILLYVDADARRAGLVHAIRIDDHEGNRNKLELASMRFDREIPRSRFAFVPPSGARRVEM
jgi:outer membrane lipoprotein carrier protein